MSILVVAEKQAISRRIAAFAREKWPGEKIVLVAGNGFYHVGFSYPRGKKLTEYPFVSAPHYKARPWSEWSALEVDAAGGVVAFEMTDEFFCSAQNIVCACEPDYAGGMLFATLMERFFGGMPDRPTRALALFALDQESIAKAFANLGDFGDVYGDCLEYGRAKRYFDWNWNVNSLAILSAAARLSGAGANDRVSKFGLQFLYFLARQDAPLSEGEAHGAMKKWRGSGKHGAPTSKISSLTSACQIIEDLIESGFVARRDGASALVGSPSSPRNLVVAAAGRRFLGNLHPDCMDVDLPFRLEGWCQDGLAESKSKMDRYVKTFFGKQKRFLAALSPRP